MQGSTLGTGRYREPGDIHLAPALSKQSDAEEMPSEGADRSRQEELNDDRECVLSDQEVSRPSENSKQEGQLVEEREVRGVGGADERRVEAEKPGPPGHPLAVLAPMGRGSQQLWSQDPLTPLRTM